MLRGMAIDRREVERIAALAHLELSTEETELFTRQLADILRYAEQIQELDTAKVVPTSYVLAPETVFREDEERPSLPRAEALAAGPDKDDMFFRVPKVIG